MRNTVQLLPTPCPRCGSKKFIIWMRKTTQPGHFLQSLRQRHRQHSPTRRQRPADTPATQTMSGKKKTSPTGTRQMLQARNAGEPEAVLHIGLLERNRIANAAKPPRQHKRRGGRIAIRPMAPFGLRYLDSRLRCINQKRSRACPET